MSPVEWILDSAISTAFALWPQLPPPTEKLRSVKIVAHRGVHENNLARENSIAAFRLALKNKIWAIELDVQFTKDNVPVVQHDSSCKRLFHRADISISKVDFAYLRDQLPDIATLEEVIAEFGNKLHLMIEVKDNLNKNPERVERLRSTLSLLTPLDDYHLLSLSPEYLEPLTFAPKAALLDVIWLQPKNVFLKNEKFKHGAIAGHFLFFSDKQLQSLKAQHKQIGVGFIKSRNSLYREINRGVDYIFTDHPLKLMSYL